MLFRKSLITLLATILLGLTTGTPARANANGHRMHVTFNRPVGLPGVTLASGTYIFEIADEYGDHNIVRVSNKDRSIVYFTAFTEPVERPAGGRQGQLVSFGEGASNGVAPIAVWWAEKSVGRRFIYAAR